MELTPSNTISFVRVLLPLALPREYIYKLPKELESDVVFGVRIEVPLKNKLYSAIVVELIDQIELEYKPRTVISIIDEKPVITAQQYTFWKWLAGYYCCTIGEVMNVALPSGLKLSSETKLISNSENQPDTSVLTDNEYLIYEALTIQKELSIGEIQKILNKKTVYPEIRGLMYHEFVYIKEDLVEKYKPKKDTYVQLVEYYKADRSRLSEAMDLAANSEKQTKMLIAFMQLGRAVEKVARKDLYDLSGGNKSILDALVKKKILETEELEVSRLQVVVHKGEKLLQPLSILQNASLNEIKGHWQQRDVVLLHGVTGSGKTQVYIELINETLKRGEQVLYLLPEIALTAQIVQRLVEVFGQKVQVYHSRMTNHERVELWNSVQTGQSIIIGARSSLFLPYGNLGLIIVDEEHDPSYKQQDPSPRYNARDASIYMGSLYGSKVLLGSATPSLESYLNTKLGKYGLVEMMERFGEVALPEIEIVDLKKERQAKTLESYFSKKMREEIDLSLLRGKQVLIFQNRRGYSPSLQCLLCGWIGECDQCDLSLTKHKFFGELRCHYCGYRTPLPKACPACGHDELKEVGYGTEKIEDVLKDLFPMAKVGRLDYDTARTRSSYENIIVEFQNKKIDILVGTQMITKGLDFDNIHVVGVLNADLLLYFPDFRASERAFQLLTQVAGRAGRRQERGKVIIQTSQPDHPVLVDTIEYNFYKFIAREAVEREKFRYPPFYRMIHITLKHKDPKVVHEAAMKYAEKIIVYLGSRVLGPAEPGISKLRGQYLRQIIVKLEKDHNVIRKAKKILLQTKSSIKEYKGWQGVRINLDVDPY